MPEPIKATRGGTLVPDWGNEGRADGEKITVHYHFLDFTEQQSLLDPRDLGKSFAYEARVLAAMIDKIDNLSVVIDEDKPMVVKTGADLVSTPGLDGLAMELWLTFRNMTAVDRKK